MSPMQGYALVVTLIGAFGAALIVLGTRRPK